MSNEQQTILTPAAGQDETASFTNMAAILPPAGWHHVGADEVGLADNPTRNPGAGRDSVSGGKK